MSTARRAVYSVLLGAFERLQDQPMAKQSAVPFIMLTDDPDLRSDTWEVRLVEPAFPMDPVRSARAIKLLGAKELGDFEETLWIDNRVELARPAEELLDQWLDGSDFTVPFHSFREQLIDEFHAVVQSGFDDPTRVYEQLIHYGETRPAALGDKPLWTGILARRTTPDVDALMRTWLDHVLRYSRRDQLSLPYVLRNPGVPTWRGLDLDNLESPWHRWPPVGAAQRRTDARHVRYEYTIQAPLAQLREVQAGLAQAETQARDAGRKDLLAALAERDCAISERDAALAERDAAAAQLETRRAEWDQALRDHETAEAESTRLARDLDAAQTRRDRAEAAVNAMRTTVSQVRREKRELAESYRAKLLAARGREAAAKAELARLKRSRAVKLARRTASALRLFKPRRRGR
jgi:hypothetical protein